MERIIVDERPEAVGIHIIQPVQLSERDSLYDREPFTSTVLQIARSFFPIQAMEQFPCRITEIEKRLAVSRNEIASALTDLKLGQSPRSLGTQHHGHCKKQDG